LNFACENCQRRYTIPDEKVRDRAVRIRCKACQHLMSVGPLPQEAEAFVPAEEEDSTRMVSLDTLEQLRAQTKSPTPAAAGNPWDEEPTRAASAVEAALWFVSSGGKQVGPFASEELRLKLRSGEIQPKNFVWKKGMGDWKRLSELPELAGLLERSAPPVPSVPRFVPPPVSGAHRAQPAAAPADSLFGSAEDLDGRQDFDAPAASPGPQRDLDARDLFADLELSKVVRAPPGLADVQDEPDLPQQQVDDEHGSYGGVPEDEEEPAPAPAPKKGKAAKTPAQPTHRATFAMSAQRPRSVWKGLLATLLVLIALAAGLATAVHERLIPIPVPPEIQSAIDEHWPVPARTQAPAPVTPPASRSGASVPPSAPPAEPGPAAGQPAPPAPSAKEGR